MRVERNMKDIELQINDILINYAQEVREEVRQEAEQTALDASLELTKESPKKSGKYAKSWQVKEGTGINYVVHSYKYYPLTHLLEFGHEIITHGVATGKRTQAFPHIKKVEEKYIKKFITDVQKRLSK